MDVYQSLCQLPVTLFDHHSLDVDVISFMHKGPIDRSDVMLNEPPLQKPPDTITNSENGDLVFASDSQTENFMIQQVRENIYRKIIWLSCNKILEIVYSQMKKRYCTEIQYLLYFVLYIPSDI